MILQIYKKRVGKANVKKENYGRPCSRASRGVVLCFPCCGHGSVHAAMPNPFTFSVE